MKVVKEGKGDKDTVENIDIGLLLWHFCIKLFVLKS